MRGGRVYFCRMPKMKNKNAIWNRGGGTREKTDALTRNQVYEIRKEGSDWQNNTRRDAAALE